MARSGRQFVLILGVTLLAALAVATAARATVYCVSEAACVAAGGTEEGTTAASVKAALLAAEAHPNAGEAPDEVVIGPGTYSLGEGFAYTNAEAVILRGAGAGSTVLTRPATSGSGVLMLGSATSTVKDLTVRVPEHEDLLGVTLAGGTLEDDTIEAPAGALTAFGLRLESGTFVHGRIIVANGTGIDQRGGEVLYSTIGATLGFGVQVATGGTLRGDVISGPTPLVSYYAKPLILEDSLIEMGGADTYGVRIVGNVNGYTEAVLDQDAIVGGGNTGVVLAGEGTVAAASLENSIISEVQVPIRIVAAGKGNSATLLSEYSSFEAAHDIETPGEGTVTLSDVHPVSGLPSFISPLTGDFRLAPGSPLIDAGAPGAELNAQEFKTDLAGDPRIVHGRRDVGPYEYQWQPPVAAASATATTAVEGEVLDFSGSASVPEPGDSITSYQWSFDDGAAVSPGASAAHAFSTLGTHTATLTATDAAGLTGTARVTVDVVGEACTASGCGVLTCTCKASPPRILHLAISPHSLHAALRGASVGRGHAGARVSYTLENTGAKLILSVVKRRPGIRVGRRCLAAEGGRHGRGCTLRRSLPGSFEQTGREGGNSFRFTGRIGGRTLPPGSYLLLAAIRGVAGSTVEVPFTVLG